MQLTLNKPMQVPTQKLVTPSIKSTSFWLELMTAAILAVVLVAFIFLFGPIGLGELFGDSIGTIQSY